MFQRRLLPFSLITLAILLLAACNPAAPAQTPTPATTPVALSDCFYSATALAFLDTNENGVYDPDEPPLEGIQFVLDPTVYSRTTSGPDGIANIFATTPTAGTNTSCDQLATQFPLHISAVTFDGYQLTTPQTVPFTDAETQYQFGFKSTLPSTGSGTPEPAEGEPAEGVGEPPPPPAVPFITTGSGIQLSPDFPVVQVNYFFEWYGEAPSIWEFEQFNAVGDRYLRADSVEGRSVDFTPQIEALLASINSLSPADSVQHTNLWTDDYPQRYIELIAQDGTSLLIYSESTGFRGHAPWYVLYNDHLYRQTNGDIGFAVYDLASDYSRNYFSLDEEPFDESLLEPPGRPTIYRTYHNFSGLLPIAQTFEYEYIAGSNALTGLFIWDPQLPDNDHSSQPLTGLEAIQLTLPDGTIEACTFESEPDPQFPEWTVHTFRCPYNSNTEQTITIAITFTTTGSPMTITGQLTPLGFVLPRG